MNTRKIQRYGWTPDHPDKRDFRYSAAGNHGPSSVDLRSLCSPVEDQGQLGSCTANALVGNVEFLENKEKTSFVNLSRLFVYFNERDIEGTVASDSGALIRDGIKTLAQLGVCDEKTWPYHIKTFTKKPTPGCYTKADAHKILSYHRLSTLAQMRDCLMQGFPFVFGFTVYDSFESAEVANTGVLNLPEAGENTIGGHAVMAVGYDDRAQRLLVRNSWGADWGQAGYFTMPYTYADDRDLSDDFWTIRK